MNIDKELLDILACPIDYNELTLEGSHLFCPAGHRYLVRDNIPIMLIEEVTQVTGIPLTAADPAASGTQEPVSGMPDANGIDWFVNKWVGATNGRMYLPCIGKLPRYPIPKFPFAKGSGKRLIDLGCSWGRWCISASIAGYKPVGVDLSFEALQAAKRVAKQLGHEIYYVVADARRLPFKNQSFGMVFSYSVLQHLDKSKVKLSLSDSNRVLVNGGRIVIELPNRFGIRNFFIWARNRFREPDYSSFDVRYWGIREARDIFTQYFSDVRVVTDGYLTINPQLADLDMLPFRYKAVIVFSYGMRALSQILPMLTKIADSFYICATK